MSDGRSFVGNMVCTDRWGNVILSQGEEFLPDEEMMVKVEEMRKAMNVNGEKEEKRED